MRRATRVTASVRVRTPPRIWTLQTYRSKWTCTGWRLIPTMSAINNRYRRVGITSSSHRSLDPLRSPIELTTAQWSQRPIIGTPRRSPRTHLRLLSQCYGPLWGLISNSCIRSKARTLSRATIQFRTVHQGMVASHIAPWWTQLKVFRRIASSRSSRKPLRHCRGLRL